MDVVKNYKRASTSNAYILHSAPSARKNYREKGSTIIKTMYGLVEKYLSCRE